MLKITFEKPSFGVADEVKNLLRKPPRKKNELPKFWTHKERLIVGSILLLTILLSVYFWYKGQGKWPKVRIPNMEWKSTVEVK